MNRPLLSLVAIVRDEAHSIVRTLESCEGAVDNFIIVDTGSTDETVEVIRKWRSTGRCGDLGNSSPDGRARSYLGEQPFIDYAVSRNNALALASPCSTGQAAGGGPAAFYALSLSADETLQGGNHLRAFLEGYSGPETCFLMEVRTATDVSHQPRVVKTGLLWRYEGAVHERLVNRAEGKDPTLLIPDCWIEHCITDPERRSKRLRKFDVPALERIILDEATEETDRTRALVLLAQTHENLAAAAADRDVGAYLRHEAAALGLYLQVTQREVDPLDALNYARLHVNLIARALGLFDDSDLLRRLAWLAEADPSRPDVAFALAEVAARLDPRAGYDRAVQAARVVRDAGNRYVLSNPSLCWKTHLLAARCARIVGDREAARKSAEAGIQVGGPREEFTGFL